MRLLAPALLPALLLGLAVGCGSEATESNAGRTPAAGAAGTWEQVSEAPLAGRVGASVVGVGTKAYVFGGDTFLCPPNADCAGPSDPPFADGAVLDLEAETWDRIADAPFGFSSASTAVLDGEIYVLSGRRLVRYTPEADTWTSLEPLPPRGGSSLVATGHGLLALAGTEENGNPQDAVFDPGTGTWTRLQDDPLPKSFDRFAVPDGDRLLVFGSPIGEPDDELRAKVVAAYGWADGTWTELPSAPAGGYQAWPAGDRVFLNPHFSKDGGGILDLATDSWGAIPDEGSGWEGDSAGVVHDEGATYEYAAGWVFDARDDSWLEVPARDSKAYDESVAAVGQALLVFGGQSWEGDEGRLVAETWVWRPPS